MTDEQPIFVEPFDLAAGQISVTIAGSGLTNLLTPDPREAWAAGSGAPYEIRISLGAAAAFDTVALIGINAAAVSSWAIDYGLSNYGENLFLASGTALRLPHEDGFEPIGSALAWRSEPVTAAFVRISITQSAPPLHQIGCLCIGKSWKPAYPHEHGAGRPISDVGVRQRIEGGGLATVPGVLNSGFTAPYADLEPADLRRIMGMMRRRRTTEPLLFVERASGCYAEELHWGTFVDLERYERRDGSKSRWSIKIEDWI